MARRVFGVETEYAVSVVDDVGTSVTSRERVVASMLKHAPDLFPSLPSWRDAGVFLGNGARFYVDAGAHPELSTPECENPWDVVRFAMAGDLMLERLARAVAAREKTSPIVVYKSNVDYQTLMTWGAHESYMHTMTPSRIHRLLVPHLVSRVIYSGAGGFVTRAGEVAFTLSPRASFLDTVISDSSTSRRGLIHLRNEPLASGGAHRLHLICGESLSSELALLLRVGTTALIVALIDAGRSPGLKLRLENPLEAMTTFASDPGCRRTARMVGCRALTAIEIQRQYLARVEATVGTACVPEWAGAICRLWRLTLDRLERGPEYVERSLDWAIKHRVYSSYIERREFTWEEMSEWGAAYATRQNFDLEYSLLHAGAKNVDPARVAERERQVRLAAAARGLDSSRFEAWRALRSELFELEARFSQVDAQGLFRQLDAAGVLDHHVDGVEDVEGAVTAPPSRGRAFVRGHSIGESAAQDRLRYRCDWDHLYDVQEDRVLDLSNVFATEGRWTPVADLDAKKHWSVLSLPDVVTRQLRRLRERPPTDAESLPF